MSDTVQNLVAVASNTHARFHLRRINKAALYAYRMNTSLHWARWYGNLWTSSEDAEYKKFYYNMANWYGVWGQIWFRWARGETTVAVGMRDRLFKMLPRSSRKPPEMENA